MTLKIKATKNGRTQNRALFEYPEIIQDVFELKVNYYNLKKF